jgi:hypothetical protein
VLGRVRPIAARARAAVRPGDAVRRSCLGLTREPSDIVTMMQCLVQGVTNKPKRCPLIAIGPVAIHSKSFGSSR